MQSSEAKPMKGNCYKSSGEYLMDEWLKGEHEQYTLVHGIPTLTVEPFTRYGHSWIEFTAVVGVIAGRQLKTVMCLDTETNNVVPRDLFYKVGRIKPEECFRYKFSEMRERINETGHWGPWEGPEVC